MGRLSDTTTTASVTAAARLCLSNLLSVDPRSSLTSSTGGGVGGGNDRQNGKSCSLDPRTFFVSEMGLSTFTTHMIVRSLFSKFKFNL